MIGIDLGKIISNAKEQKIHHRVSQLKPQANIFKRYSPGFILTVDDGRWEEEPGEKEESTAEEELRE